MSRTGHTASPLDDVISAQEASELLGLSKRQVTRLAESGQIEGKLLGKQWAISKSSVLELKAQREAHQGDE
jgi:excisionase family DNA binding protein